MSRILNRDFTPVSHPCMNMKAAPGQIPLKDILEVSVSTDREPMGDVNFFLGRRVLFGSIWFFLSRGLRYEVDG